MIKGIRKSKNDAERFCKNKKIFSEGNFILSIIDGGVFLHETDPTIFPELHHCIDIGF